MISKAETEVFILIDGKIAGSIALADAIRAESKEAVQQLKKENIKSVLLTGDNKVVAAAVAGTLEMDSYFAEVLPHQKLEKKKNCNPITNLLL